MPESVLSRLARSTELSKTESRSAGAVRIQSRRTRYKSESDCPRNLSTIRAAQNPVNASPSQNFHVISTVGRSEGGGLGSKKGSFQRTMVWPSASKRSFRRRPKRKTEN